MTPVNEKRYHGNVGPKYVCVDGPALSFVVLSKLPKEY